MQQSTPHFQKRANRPAELRVGFALTDLFSPRTFRRSKTSGRSVSAVFFRDELMKQISLAWYFAASLALALGGCAKSSSGGVTCDTGFTDCSGACTALLVDPSNCGTCGNSCMGGVACVGGVCGGTITTADAGTDSAVSDAWAGDDGSTASCSSCGSTQACCGSTCVNDSVALDTDGRSDSSFAHCGGCDMACDATLSSACSVRAGGSSPTCMCGTTGECSGGRVCTALSSGGFGCVGPTDGGVTDSGTDGGMVGGACGSTTCRAAGVMGSSDLGQLCCSDVCVEQDATHCGTCGNSCSSSALSGLGALPGLGSTVACGPGANISGLLTGAAGGGGGGSTSTCCEVGLSGMSICVDSLSSLGSGGLGSLGGLLGDAGGLGGLLGALGDGGAGGISGLLDGGLGGLFGDGGLGGLGGLGGDGGLGGLGGDGGIPCIPGSPIPIPGC